ncbi:sensor histidine kinase [Arthrobacter sulfonylureivorans]|uniref:sensor histidine kinase n=1 Tax=Arthrobacter sulfonylureivorans TaxID=2486855 RepID=UPI0039E2B277
MPAQSRPHDRTGAARNGNVTATSEAPTPAEGPEAAEGPKDAVPASQLVLRILRVGLHVGFAGLLALAIAAMLTADPASPTTYLAAALAVLLATVYVAGTVWEKRRSSSGTGRDLNRYAPWWLALVTLLWTCLVVLSGNFVWLAFPLFFLHLHILRTWHAVIAVAVLTGLVIASQWWHAGKLEPAMLIGPVVGAVFAVFMGMAYRALYLDAQNQRLALAELRRTRAELASSQHEAGVLAERGRLASEIHDTLAQGLSSIVLLSRGAAAALDAGQPATAAERIRLMESTASDNLAEARRFVRGLSSPQLDPQPGQQPEREPGSMLDLGADRELPRLDPHAGGPSARPTARADTQSDGAPTTQPMNGPSALVPSLQRLCAATESQAAGSGRPLRCRFVLDGSPVQLPPAVEVLLLRASQASLANVLEHAQASTAVVTLGFLPGEVTVDIYDDGAGFDPSAAGPREDGRGFGLRSLAERAAALGGTMTVESATGEGTVVAVRLPLPAADEERQ